MKLQQVNTLARLSLPANNRNRVLRKIFREMVYWTSRRHADDGFHEIIETVRDNEPWPFSEPGFCPWDEDENPEHYTLFANPAGFVVGHCTAYCSAMIMLETGEWPMVRSLAKVDCRTGCAAEVLWKDCPHEFDAKNWISFLILNGYKNLFVPDESWAISLARATECDVRCRVFHAKPLTESKFVGVNPNDGEFGSLVWFEGTTDDEDYALVSTKTQRTFQLLEVPYNDYVWVEIRAKKAR